jgi:hypothetical protein
MKIDKNDIRLFEDAFSMYSNHLWQMANASYLGGNIPKEYMPKYDRFLELEEYFLKELNKRMKSDIIENVTDR